MNDVGRGCCRIGDRRARNDAGEHFLPADLIRNGGDRGMAAQHAFHLHCADVLAAATDYVLLAINKGEIAVRIGAHDIAQASSSGKPNRFSNAAW